MKSCNTVWQCQAHSRDTTRARHEGTKYVSHGARAYHVPYFLESCPLDPLKFVSRLRNVLLPNCLPIRYVPIFVSHIMSAASLDLKIDTGQQSSKEHDLSKQLGPQQVQQMVEYVKFWLSVLIIRTSTYYTYRSLEQSQSKWWQPL